MTKKFNIYNSEMFQSVLSQLLSQNDTLREALALAQRRAVAIGEAKVVSELAEATRLDEHDIKRALEALRVGAYDNESIDKLTDALLGLRNKMIASESEKAGKNDE